MSLSQAKIDDLASEYQQIQENTNLEEDELLEHQKKILNYEIQIEKLREKYKKLCMEHKVEFQEDYDYSENKTTINEQSLNCNLASEKINELSINENIEKGFQRISLKLISSWDKLKPINDLISDDLKNNEKIAIIYEKAKSIILNLSLQVYFSYYLLNNIYILKE